MSVKSVVILLLSAMWWTVATAQELKPDEQRVRSLDDEERVAALKRDIPSLERLWSEHFVVNAPNNQVVVGRKMVLDTFVHAGIIDFSRFDREIEYIRSDGPFVIIMGLETVQPAIF